MSDGAEVIPLRPELSDAPVRTREGPPRYCQHLRVELDGTARRVYCRDCKLEVPAYDFLRRLAQEFERWTRTRDEAERLALAAKERLEETLRLERNAKARVKAAQAALGRIQRRMM